ncbi:winged helix-turn-helix domain-containing protein [Sphingomonas tabacisoli]|uniref:Winged helix-turn-helix domain-containing protein n=1 Tax=Sphingomonas tabacisoli TaxID=2249466 RepID=A0ABW4I6Z7_9SPHN
MAGSGSRIAFESFVLDRGDERLLGESGPIRIGHKAYCVLDALIAADGRLVTKDELFDCVWDGAAVSESALTSVVKELRRALGDDTREPRFIESVYGRGYRFLAPVSVSPNIEREALTRAPGLPAVRSNELQVSRRVAVIGIGTAIVAAGAVAMLRPIAVSGLFNGAGSAHRIAVLPFANLSGDPKQDYFSDGMAEELRSRLSRLPALQVAARTSSNSFRGAAADIGSIGRKLGVSYIVEGSVRRDAGAVRIAARLIDARTGFERWSQSYDRPFADILTLQGDIAQSVTRALEGEVLGAHSASLDRAGTTSPEAFDAYARGRALFDLSGDEVTYRNALAAFDRAIALDPRYAAAHAARARTLAALASQFVAADRLKPTFAEGLQAARRAVALAPDLDEAQSALGYLLVNGSLDFAAAHGPYERSRALGANNADVLIRYGLFATRAGRMDAGLEALRRASVLDPLNPRAFKALGQALYVARRYREALTPLRHALELNPQISSVSSSIGDCLLLSGQATAAAAAYRHEPLDFARNTGLAIAEARLGRKAQAQEAFDSLVEKSGDSGAYQQAQVLAQWGQTQKAFEKLDAAFRVGDPGLIYLRNDPMLDPLRRDSRFFQMLARLGLSA